MAYPRLRINLGTSTAPKPGTTTLKRRFRNARLIRPIVDVVTTPPSVCHHLGPPKRHLIRHMKMEGKCSQLEYIKAVRDGRVESDWPLADGDEIFDWVLADIADEIDVPRPHQI